MSNKTIEVKSEQEKNIRLDKFLSDSIPEITRSKIQDLIKNGFVSTQAGEIKNAKYKIQPDETFIVTIPEQKPLDLAPKKMNLNIVYEDEYLIVINKPAGLTTHPGAGNTTDTLVNGLLANYQNNLSSVGGITRPGIVHRLDKDTTGLLVVAKDDQTHALLSQDLAERKIKRIYNALVWGLPFKTEDTIQTYVAKNKNDRKRMAIATEDTGKLAVTNYKVLNTFLSGRISLLECSLETGRTHQIRLHMQHINHHIIGDSVYGVQNKKRKFTLSPEVSTGLKKINRQMLHAKKLSFTHPRTGKNIDLEVDLPDDMNSVISLINSC